MEGSFLNKKSDLENGIDREMTKEEKDEFFWLGVDYNKVAPRKDEYLFIPPDKRITLKVKPMDEGNIYATYNDLVKRRKLCLVYGIVFNPIMYYI